MDRTVLIIDDSPTLRRIVKFNMKNIQGFSHQLEASDGIEALEILATNNIDLILLDVNMPKMDGFEFLEKAKKDPKISRIPIIMLTTEGEEASKKKALEMGASDYLTKPFQSPDLKRIISKLFG